MGGAAVWCLVVLAAVGLRFYRELALFWFGVALWQRPPDRQENPLPAVRRTS